MKYDDAIALFQSNNISLALQMKLLEKGKSAVADDAPYSNMDYCRAEYQAVDLALSALRDAQEREKGCAFCTGDVDGRTSISAFEGEATIYIDGNDLLTIQDSYGNTDDAPIKLCFNCGRKLRGE